MNDKRLDLERTVLVALALLGGSLAVTYRECAAADMPAKAQGAAEPGWQKVFARKGGCVMYVPPDWKLDPVLKGAAGLSDNSANAVVSLADAVSTLARVKPVMQSNFEPTKTFEDSPHRLWYQYSTGSRLNFYVGVPVKGGICGAQIGFKPGKEAIANKIAATVGAGS